MRQLAQNGEEVSGAVACREPNKALFANRTHMLPVAMLPTLSGARADVVILSRKWYAFFPERPTDLVKNTPR